MKFSILVRFTLLAVFFLSACGDSVPDSTETPSCELDDTCVPDEPACDEPGGEPCEPPACDEPGGEPCEPPACDEPGGEPCEPPACDEPGGEPCEPPACDEPGGQPCEPPKCDEPGGEPCEPPTCGEPGAHPCPEVCPGPECDCALVPTPVGCSSLSDVIELSEVDLQTSEAPVNDLFELRLKVEPTSEVVIWVEPSNADEAVAFPIKLLFCPVGFTDLYSACVPVAEAEAVLGPQTEVHWSRTIPVEVLGVADRTDDADINYVLRFEVVSEDARFSAVSNLYLPGVNTNVPFTEDISHLDGLQDEALLQALYTDVSDHRAFGYSGTNGIRTLMFSVVDLYQGGVEGMYTGKVIQLPRDSRGASPMGFNTEHSWPQSQFDKQEPVRGDLHHLFPTDSMANGNRSAFDYGMVASASPTNPDSVLGLPTGGSKNVYQVRPERRGDVARAHFYMVARYRYDTTLTLAFDDDLDMANGSINAFEEAVLRQWSIDDPVDAIESARNNRIAAYQGKRNPFVDNPELVTRIADF